ncbi:MAG: DUF3365 domain-containing protein, partial [Deltaproteobacteria bacterium]|nr:DUF3365 domain-containing protein [Deltaproteobacteria bacterium]
ETEVRSVEKIEGKDYFRLMRPFKTEEACLKCHSVQGYQKGEIRGGISVSNSMTALYAIEWKSMRRLGATHLLISLIGWGGIGLMAHRINRSEAVRKQAEEEREKMIGDLKKALSQVKTLSGFIPICASCKKIRDDKGYWEQVEIYIRDHSEAEFSHGICPDFMKKLYPDETLEDL